MAFCEIGVAKRFLTASDTQIWFAKREYSVRFATGLERLQRKPWQVQRRHARAQAQARAASSSSTWSSRKQDSCAHEKAPRPLVLGRGAQGAGRDGFSQPSGGDLGGRSRHGSIRCDRHYRTAAGAAAGGLRGAPVELVKAVSNGMKVPARAEIVIEFTVDTKNQKVEGPLGEYTGFYTPGSMKPIARPLAITHRNGAYFQCLLTGVPPTENHVLKQLPFEASF